MTRFFCHECSFEDDGFPTNAEGPVCPQCQGAFVEEVRSSAAPSSSNITDQPSPSPLSFAAQIPADEPGADDPRDFDPDDDGDAGGAAFPFGFAGGVAGGGPPAFLQFVAPPPGAGGPFVAAAQGGLNPLTTAMLQAFGMIAPPQGVRPQTLRRVQSEGAAAEQPRADQAGAGEGGDARREQVPLRNLAA